MVKPGKPPDTWPAPRTTSTSRRTRGVPAGFAQRLGQRRVGVDGERQVLCAQPCLGCDGSLSGQFGHASAYRVGTEQVTASNDRDHLPESSSISFSRAE